MHPKGKILELKFISLCLKVQILWCQRWWKCYCAECFEIRNIGLSVIGQLLQTLVRGERKHESTRVLVTLSFCLANYYHLKVHCKVEGVCIHHIHLYSCIYVHTHTYIKVYTGLVEFSEDGVGVLPIVSHLQKKYTVSRPILWTLSPLGDVWPGCSLLIPACMTLYCFVFSHF